MRDPMDVAAWRAKHIFWCPVCEQDTMPNVHTGECFWCDTMLVPEPDEPKPTTAVCDLPTCAVEFSIEGYRHSKRYCCEQHRKRAWHQSPAGREDRFQAVERSRRKRAELRARGLTKRGTVPVRRAA